ncbi:MAG: DUF309 domain-containing protein [Nodosilinea sp.]
MASSAPAEKPNAPLAEGIALFNRGDYYACHDVLEAIWMEADTSDKSFYQGILQIAVGLYHLGNHNWQGAAILLGEGVNRLRGFEPAYAGVAVAQLVDCGWAWLMALQHTGASQVTALAEVLTQFQGPVEQLAGTTPEIPLEIEGDMMTLPRPYIYPARDSGA